MAVFQYIGTMTNTDGTVDARCTDSNGVQLEWKGLKPGVSFDVGTDPKVVKSFEYAVDMYGNFNYVKVSG